MAKPLIMVVDDEKNIADFITRTIRETGEYDVITAYSGPEALKLLAQNKILLGIGGNKVRLIFLDIKMPGMDGLELLEKIRKDFGPDIGITMLTAWEDAEKWERATSGFVVNYLKKPFKSEELMATIDRFFKGGETKMVIETFEKHMEKREEFKKKE
ncbi:MAG: response regulator [Candidatus Margulisbacteria bacterium]|nr:response regulator [Candidatus Margulisiibacteriota bacterium]